MARSRGRRASRRGRKKGGLQNERAWPDRAAATERPACAGRLSCLRAMLDLPGSSLGAEGRRAEPGLGACEARSCAEDPGWGMISDHGKASIGRKY